jgi:hypothetical protein
MFYSAAWTDSGFLLGCSHEHETIVDADCCIPCAGGYVVGVENGVMRSLTAEEETEFQCAVPSHSTENPAVETTPAAPAVSDSGYAVMTRIRVGDHWTWATWMCFETYAEAAGHARDGNKVVRFRSPEWAALRQQTEAASPIVINAPRESIPARGEGETLLEFVLRFLSAYGFAPHAEPIPNVKHGVANTDMIDLVLSRLSGWETIELERMYAVDRHALLRALQTLFFIIHKSQRRLH